MRKTGKMLSICLSAVILTQTAVFAEFEWAEDAVRYCTQREILSGTGNGDFALGDSLTREQMTKILVDAFDIEIVVDEENPEPVIMPYDDIEEGRWSYEYICAFLPYIKKKMRDFRPEELVTREEFAASLVLASGLKEANIRNPGILAAEFFDASDVDSDYKKLLSIAVERGYMSGSDQLIHPKELLTRAEACSLVYRVLGSKEGLVTLKLGIKETQTPMIGTPEVTLEQAKAWATKKGATQKFIDVADVYWEYGQLTGIRPEILYAQAAKETGFGKFGGAVVPEQNNWAGIKVKGATLDRMEDHETFETPEDGVRGHFNHMSAYIGLAPIGEPHGRYHSIKTMPWAGTVKYLEELGGKWCPDLYYGYSIKNDWLGKI